MFPPPPGDNPSPFARLDRLSGARHGLEPRATQPVHRLPWHVDGKAREQQCQPRYVAVVLARLVGAAQDNVIDRGGGDPPPPHHRPYPDPGEVIRAPARPRPPPPPHGRPPSPTNKNVEHYRPTPTPFV